MLELRPVETVGYIQPLPKVLLPGWWVAFSANFPSSLLVGGKTYQILKQQQVNYPYTWTIKEACYVDVDLSNDATGLQLYPPTGNANLVYEVLIGMRKGNYFAQLYFPAGYPIYRLDSSTMTPTITSSTLKYLGAITPKMSPVDNAIFKLYLLGNLTPVILRLYADDGKAYEQITLDFTINRCLMQQATPPANVTPKPIYYLDEIKWMSVGPGTGGQ